MSKQNCYHGEFAWISVQLAVKNIAYYATGIKDVVLSTLQLLILIHLDFITYFKQLKDFSNVEIEVQPKDTSRGHFYVSVVKSAVRVAAGVALIIAGLSLVGWLFILAEILGIIEELV